MTTARLVLERCIARGWTLATAESITAGGIAAALATEPGCSAVLRGGIIAYDPAVKVDLLNVDADLVRHVVSAPVAAAMASGARSRLGADIAVATTGVAGPDLLDDQPPGTVWCGVAVPDGPVRTVCWHLAGDRVTIQQAAVEHALAWVGELLG